MTLVTRMLWFFLLLIPMLAQASGYSVSWTSVSSLPVPINPLFLMGLIPLILLLVKRKLQLHTRLLTASIGISMLLSGLLVTQSTVEANGGRTLQINTDSGEATLTCSENTLVVAASLAIRLDAVLPDFNTALADTLVCGTVCVAGATLQPGESCTLRCPGGTPLDSDGDGYGDTVDGRECDDTSSFGMRFSGV